MQVVPNMPHPESTGSERQVLKLLRSVDWGGSGARALNSLNLSEHAYQRWGEIDFLVVGRPGLIVVEVKGGAVSCVDGIWRYEDRLGRVVRRSKSPVVQAKDAYFSLVKNYISTRFGDSFATSVPSGFCVLLAGVGKAELAGLLGTPELPAELTGTREDLANPAALGAFLGRVASYWRTKTGCAASIPERDVAALVALLRPEFESVQSLALSRDLASQELVKLTEEQYDLLDHWEGAKRVLCSAPAGCGKTLLAVELLRRETEAGGDCLMVSGTRQLAHAVRARVAFPDRVWSFDEIQALPPYARPVARSLVVDEGQQLLSRDCLALLDALVQGGIASGRWAWFGDPNYQLPAEADSFGDVYKVLVDASTVQPRLRKNCRNTPEIVAMAELASGVPLGHAIVKGRGVEPVIVGVDGGDAIAAAASRHVAGWLAEGIASGEVCVLVEGCNPSVLAESAARQGGFRARPWSAGAGERDGVPFAAVEDFRGLESPFVTLCIAAFPGGDDALARRLYLAMTRANLGLAIIAPKAEVARIERLVEKSLAGMME